MGSEKIPNFLEVFGATSQEWGDAYVYTVSAGLFSTGRLLDLSAVDYKIHLTS